MRLTRRGSRRDKGTSSIRLAMYQHRVFFNLHTKEIRFNCGFVRDFSSDTQHNYCVSITVDELNALNHGVAKAIEKGELPPESIKKLKTSLADLLQIATACSKQEPKQE